MKDKKLTFSKLELVASKLCFSIDAALTHAEAYRRDRTFVTRTFKRTVKAGGASFAVYISVVRKRANFVSQS